MLKMIVRLKMAAEQVESMEHNLKVAVVDLLLAECMMFEVEVERKVVEQLVVVDTVSDTAVRPLVETAGQLVELPLMTVHQQIHSMQSKVEDIVQIDW